MQSEDGAKRGMCEGRSYRDKTLAQAGPNDMLIAAAATAMVNSKVAWLIVLVGWSIRFAMGDANGQNTFLLLPQPHTSNSCDVCVVLS